MTDPLLSRLSALAGMMAVDGQFEAAKEIAAIATEPLTFCDCGRTHAEKQFTAPQTTNHRSPMPKKTGSTYRITTTTVSALRQLADDVIHGNKPREAIFDELLALATALDEGADNRETLNKPKNRKPKKAKAVRRSAIKRRAA